MAEISATVKQLHERVDYYDTYKMTTATFIGPESQLSGVASSNKKGSKYQGIADHIVQSSTTDKIEADRLKWTVTYKTVLSTGGGGGGGASDPYISRTWSMSMTQYEYPLYKYLNAEEAKLLKKWETTDDEHRGEFKYVSAFEEGTGNKLYGSLSGMPLSVATKMWNGVESVLRFYPQATRTSIYEDKQTFAYIYGNLNHIDDTPDDEFSELSCQWLKSGADWTENNDTTWTLTESWIGAPHWDSNLYGLGAWNFYEPA
jgi:hypothetical protein